jgi:hypothetical protein
VFGGSSEAQVKRMVGPFVTFHNGLSAANVKAQFADGALFSARAKAMKAAGIKSNFGALGAPATSGACGHGATVPCWSASVTSPLDGKTYTMIMVGSSPYAKSPVNTNVTYVPIVLRIHGCNFTQTAASTATDYCAVNFGVVPAVVDPTQNAACDTQSSSQRFFNSPLFRATTFSSNGVNVSNIAGGTQLVSAFQRANFWQYVKNTTYGVTLTPSQLNPIVVDWTLPGNPNLTSGSLGDADQIAPIGETCGAKTINVNFTLVDINELDVELQAIAAQYAGSTRIPVVLVPDAIMYDSQQGDNCCILGYHNAVNVKGGIQVYAIGAYYDVANPPFIGSGFPDITVWSHEMSELVDDPFDTYPATPDLTNYTPNWGNTGQTLGCDNELEVGDPLTPSQLGNYGVFAVPGTGGFVYHQQDLVFHDWFFRTASTGTGGKYSFKGTFSTVQGACS